VDPHVDLQVSSLSELPHAEHWLLGLLVVANLVIANKLLRILEELATNQSSGIVGPLMRLLSLVTCSLRKGLTFELLMCEFGTSIVRNLLFLLVKTKGTRLALRILGDSFQTRKGVSENLLVLPIFMVIATL